MGKDTDNTEEVQELKTKDLTSDNGKERRWGRQDGGSRARHDTGSLECIPKDMCC